MTRVNLSLLVANLCFVAALVDAGTAEERYTGRFLLAWLVAGILGALSAGLWCARVGTRRMGLAAAAVATLSFPPTFLLGPAGGALEDSGVDGAVAFGVAALLVIPVFFAVSLAWSAALGKLAPSSFRT